jgi:hypothetical protein
MKVTGRHLCTAAVSLCLLGWLLPSTTLGETLGLSEYRDRIRRAIASLEADNGEAASQKIEALVRMFPEAFVVRNGHGTVSVTRRSVIGPAPVQDASPQTIQQILAHLQALEEQISVPAPELQALLPDLHDTLSAVYRGREFAHLRQQSPGSWLAKVFDYIRSLLSRLGQHFPSLGSVDGLWLQAAAYGVLLLSGLVLAVWLVRNFRGVGWQRRVPSVAAPSFSRTEQRSWTAWREEAHRRCQDGAYREAVRCLFISVMLEGGEKGWWPYEPQATNSEHLARLPQATERRTALARLIRRYEEVWYGMMQPTEPDYRQCETWVQQMENTS